MRSAIPTSAIPILCPRRPRQPQRASASNLIRLLLLIALHTATRILLLLSESASSFSLVTLPVYDYHQTPSSSSSSSSSLLSSRRDSSLKSSTSTSSLDSKSQQQEQQHVVIVGGGVGGLAVAARIASNAAATTTTKTKVTLLEKNAQIGGRCGSFWVDPENDDDNNNENENCQKGRFRHEQGPSLLLLPSVYEDVFTDTTTTSKTASDYGLDIVQCVPAYQVVFDDGDRISVGFPATNDDDTREEEEEEASLSSSRSRAKMDTFEADGAKKWDDYMAITSAYLDAGLPNFIEERLDLLSLPEFLVQSLKDYGKAWPLKPHSDVLDALFDSNKLKSLASFQDLYVGLEPYRNSNLIGGGVLKSTAPAVFGLLAAIELHPTNKKAGVFAPIGGFQAVTNALESLVTELGVDIRCDTNVMGITNDGVWANDNGNNKSKLDDDDDDDSSSSSNEFIPADLIIVNADLPYAKKSLLIDNVNGGGSNEDSSANTADNNNIPHSTKPVPPPILTEKFDWDDSFSFSSGVISFYWSLDKPLDDLNTHNVFLSTKSRSQAEASWQALREPQAQSQTQTQQRDNDGDGGDVSFNFYVHRPSKTDPTAAPPGCDTIMVLVPCRTLLRDEECANLPRKDAMDRYQQQFPPEVVSQVRRAVLKRFAAVESLQDIEDHIIHEEYRTPATWADRYNLAAGTPFALSHGFAQLSLTRPGPESSGLPNVLYCGASTRPGNGVPLVLIGAKQVAEKAIKSLRSAD